MDIHNPKIKNQRRVDSKQSEAKLSLSEKVAETYSKYFPDSMIFALILTIVSMVLAILLTDSGPIRYKSLV